MIDPTAPEPPVELSAVLADEALVAQLSRRAPLSEPEPLAMLLASWASEVDAATECDLAGAAPIPTPMTPLTAVASRRRSHRSRRFARGSRLAVVVTAVGVGLGSLTGVAAAVTGDPLAPYRPVISGVLGGAGSGGSGSTQPGSTDPGASTEGARAAKKQGPAQESASAKGEHPAAAPGLAASQAARDGWLAHWPGLPPQAVGPYQRPGLDGTAGASRPGGPAFTEDGDRPGSSRADEVRRNGDKREGNGANRSQERDGDVAPRGARASDGEDAGASAGHQALRR